MQTEKQKKFIINCLYVILIGAILYILFEYALGFLLPFFVAYIVSAIIRPIVKTMEQRLKISHKIASLIVLVFFYCTVGVLLFLIGFGVFSYLKDLITMLPSLYKTKLEPVISTALVGFEFPEDFDPTLAEAIKTLIKELYSSIGTIVSGLSGKLLSVISSFASSLPTLVIGVIFSIISSYYFTADHEKLYDFLKRQCKPSFYEKIIAVRSAIREIISSYVKSYAIILSITFAELTVAMLILGTKNFVIIGLLIATFDILPVVGTGTILLPWAVFEFLTKDYKMAVGLLITYVIVFIVRQIIEPKIIGHHVGLHPLVTLVAMFAGTILFGVVGLFGIPICIAIIVDLDEKGVINVFK